MQKTGKEIFRTRTFPKLAHPYKLLLYHLRWSRVIWGQIRRNGQRPEKCCRLMSDRKISTKVQHQDQLTHYELQEVHRKCTSKKAAKLIEFISEFYILSGGDARHEFQAHFRLNYSAIITKEKNAKCWLSRAKQMIWWISIDKFIFSSGFDLGIRMRYDYLTFPVLLKSKQAPPLPTSTSTLFLPSPPFLLLSIALAMAIIKVTKINLTSNPQKTDRWFQLKMECRSIYKYLYHKSKNVCCHPRSLINVVDTLTRTMKASWRKKVVFWSTMCFRQKSGIKLPDEW